MPGFVDSVTGATALDVYSKSGRIEVNVGAVDGQVPGGDVDNNRLLTCEVWNYGEDNIGPASAVVKAAPGVLGVAQVITPDAEQTVTFYDDPDSANGTILGILPLDVAGTQIYFRRPASVGIWAEFSGSTGVVAVGYL